MLNPDSKAPAERSSLLIFFPITIVGAYLLYLTIIIPFKHGKEHGELEKLVNPPKAAEVAKEEKVYDHRKLMKTSAELVELGAKVYVSNCQSCHGESGLGNGTAGSKLAVKPRNFHEPSDKWKSGASVLTMYHTLEKGLGSMPAFPALDPEQRYAVIHYVHESYMKEVGWPADTDAAIAALPAAGGAISVSIDAYKETRVPVDYAIMQMLRDASGIKDGQL